MARRIYHSDTQVQRDEKAAENCYELFAFALGGYKGIGDLTDEEIGKTFDLHGETISKLRKQKDVAIPIKSVFRMMKAFGIELVLSEKKTKA